MPPAGRSSAWWCRPTTRRIGTSCPSSTPSWPRPTLGGSSAWQTARPIHSARLPSRPRPGATGGSACTGWRRTSASPGTPTPASSRPAGSTSPSATTTTPWRPSHSTRSLPCSGTIPASTCSTATRTSSARTGPRAPTRSSRPAGRRRCSSTATTWPTSWSPGRSWCARSAASAPATRELRTTTSSSAPWITTPASPTSRGSPTTGASPRVRPPVAPARRRGLAMRGAGLWRTTWSATASPPGSSASPTTQRTTAWSSSRPRRPASTPSAPSSRALGG